MLNNKDWYCVYYKIERNMVTEMKIFIRNNDILKIAINNCEVQYGVW